MTRSELFRTNVGADPVEIGRNHRNDLQNLWYDDLRDALIALEKALKKILRTREYDPKKSSADLKEICTALQAKLMSDPDEIFDIVNMVGELSLVSARVEAIPVEKQEKEVCGRGHHQGEFHRSDVLTFSDTDNQSEKTLQRAHPFRSGRVYRS